MIGAILKNLGVKERPGLVVLRRTKMPAVLVEAGFINNGEDNRIFDENFEPAFVLTNTFSHSSYRTETYLCFLQLKF